MDPGCCTGDDLSCYVPEGTCYCDRSCHIFKDCCLDVSLRTCLARGISVLQLDLFQKYTFQLMSILYKHNSFRRGPAKNQY